MICGALPRRMLQVVQFVLLHYGSTADLDYSRLHIVDTYSRVDHEPINLLARSNMPVNASGFDLDGLIAGISKRATALHLALEYPLYLRVVSLNNDFDKHFDMEKKFWRDHANEQFGCFTNWPLGLAGIEPPGPLSPQKRQELLNTTVWAVDQLPARISKLRQLLTDPTDPPTPPGRSSVTVVHCTAGCDRTGEVIGAYRTLYGGLDANGQHENTYDMKSAYALDTSECGRSPNYWSTTALEWWCFDLEYERQLECGNCTDFALCHPLKHGQPCEPTNNSHVIPSS